MPCSKNVVISFRSHFVVMLYTGRSFDSVTCLSRNWLGKTVFFFTQAYEITGNIAVSALCFHSYSLFITCCYSKQNHKAETSNTATAQYDVSHFPFFQLLSVVIVVETLCMYTQSIKRRLVADNWKYAINTIRKSIFCSAPHQITRMTERKPNRNVIDAIAEILKNDLAKSTNSIRRTHASL